MNAVPQLPIQNELPAAKSNPSAPRDTTVGESADKAPPSFLSTLREIKGRENSRTAGGAKAAPEIEETAGDDTTALIANENQRTESDTSAAVAVLAPNTDTLPKKTTSFPVSDLTSYSGPPVTKTSEGAGVERPKAGDDRIKGEAVETALRPVPTHAQGSVAPKTVVPGTGALADDAAALPRADNARAAATSARGVQAENVEEQPGQAINRQTTPSQTPTAKPFEADAAINTIAAHAPKNDTGSNQRAGNSKFDPPPAVKTQQAQPGTNTGAGGQETPVEKFLEGETASTTESNRLASDLQTIPNRVVQVSRAEADQRPDGITAVDRGLSPSASRGAQPPTAEKALPPSTEDFRENNLPRIVERIAVTVRGGQSEARIALKPDHLGAMRVQIATENNTVSIKITTEFSMARDLLESHLPQLKMELQQQGLEVEEFDVTLNEKQHDFRREERWARGNAKNNSGPGNPEKTDERPQDSTPRETTGIREDASAGIDYFA